jgi:uncharacterized protein (DUF433 family)
MMRAMTVEERRLLDEAIWIHPERMSGAPCFQGTRVPVQDLVDILQHGGTIEDFLAASPSVSRRQVDLFLDLAKVQLAECASS